LVESKVSSLKLIILFEIQVIHSQHQVFQFSGINLKLRH